MKKFSEMKFKKPNLKKIEQDFNNIIEEFENASTFEQQNNALIVKKDTVCMMEFVMNVQNIVYIVTIQYSVINVKMNFMLIQMEIVNREINFQQKIKMN